MTIALITTIIGLVVYILGSRTDERVEELGRLAFFAGLLAYLLGH